MTINLHEVEPRNVVAINNRGDIVYLKGECDTHTRQGAETQPVFDTNRGWFFADGMYQGYELREDYYEHLVKLIQLPDISTVPHRLGDEVQLDNGEEHTLQGNGLGFECNLFMIDSELYTVDLKPLLETSPKVVKVRKKPQITQAVITPRTENERERITDVVCSLGMSRAGELAVGKASPLLFKTMQVGSTYNPQLFEEVDLKHLLTKVKKIKGCVNIYQGDEGVTLKTGRTEDCNAMSSHTFAYVQCNR